MVDGITEVVFVLQAFLVLHYDGRRHVPWNTSHQHLGISGILGCNPVDSLCLILDVGLGSFFDDVVVEHGAIT